MCTWDLYILPTLPWQEEGYICVLLLSLLSGKTTMVCGVVWKISNLACTGFSSWFGLVPFDKLC